MSRFRELTAASGGPTRGVMLSMADGKALELTSENFDTTVGGDQPSLVDFWADWCGPCRMIAPTISELAEDFEGRAVVGKVNVDDEPRIAEKFRVRSIPTLLFFQEGEVVGQIVGVQSKANLAARLEELIG